MPQSSKKFSGIFISYRREDSAGHAGRVFDRLSSHFGEDHIFMDVDHLEPGEDFVQAIEDAVSSCGVLIAIIGRQWLSSSPQGSRRLDNPHDFVRLEIAAALNRNIRVIPILVQGASMPRPEDLPDDLVKLSRRQAQDLSDLRWKHDVDRLIRAIQKALSDHRDALNKEQEEAALAKAAEEEEERLRCEAEARAKEEEIRRQEAEEKSRLEAKEDERIRAEAYARERSKAEAERQRIEAERNAELRRLEKKERERAETERLRLKAEEAVPELALRENGHEDKQSRKILFANIACFAVLAVIGFHFIRPLPLFGILDQTILRIVIALANLALIALVWKTDVPETAQWPRRFVLIMGFIVLGIYASSYALQSNTGIQPLIPFICAVSLVFAVIIFIRSTAVPPPTIRAEVSVIIAGLVVLFVFIGGSFELATRWPIVICSSLFVVAVLMFAGKAHASPKVKLTGLLAAISYIAILSMMHFWWQDRALVQLAETTTFSSSLTATEHAARGNELYQQQQYAEAEQHYREAVRLEPSNVEYNNNLGDALYKQQKYSEAEPYYREVVRLDPGNANKHNNLGLSLEFQRKYAEAESEYREAVRLKPSNAGYNNNLGDALYKQQKYPEAEPYYREAVRLEPNNAAYNNNLGDALNWQNKYPEAEPYYREAVRLDPDSASRRNDLGISLELQRKYVEAESEYREAVRLEPANASYNNNLGDALFKQQKYAEAEPYYREAVRLDPNKSVYQENLKRIKALTTSD